MASRFMLRNQQKQDSKPYLKDVRFSTTGFDLTYSSEKGAMQFETRSVAIVVRQSLALFGDFWPVEVRE